MAKIMIMTVHIPMFFSLNDTDIISRQYPHRVWLNDWSEDGLVHFLAISFVFYQAGPVSSQTASLCLL